MKYHIIVPEILYIENIRNMKKLNIILKEVPVESQASIQLFDTGDEYKIKSPKPSGGGVGEKICGDCRRTTSRTSIFILFI